MNLIPSFLRRWRQDTQPQSAVTLNNPGWLSDWSRSNIALFGGSVSEETALAQADVYRCVTLISGVIASLDLGIYQDDPREGRVQITNTKLHSLLTVKPYPSRNMTAFTWKELLVMNLLLAGNAFSAIRYDGAGRVSAMEYAPPSLVTIERRGGGTQQRVIYTVNWDDGRDPEEIDQDNMIHIMGPGDGLVGMSRLQQNMRNSVAMARSVEEVLGRAHDNAMSPRLVVKVPAGMDAESLKRLKAFLDGEFTGRKNVAKTLMLDAGSEVDALQISVTDLNLLSHMHLNTLTLCKFYGVPPILLGESQDTTAWGAGIEQIVLGWLRFGLNSDLERIEAELTAKLCSSGQYILFDRDQLLTMDAVAAADVASKEIACGMSTINEARIRKHRPIVENGDVPLVNSTNVSLKRAIEQPQPTNVPSPPTTDGGENNDDN